VVILCRNEADNLARCIEPLGACAEVVVLDDGSTDGSPAIARSVGARVVEHPFTSFADQRNWAMNHAGLAMPWVLHLDADEVLTSGALEEIARLLPSMPVDSVGFLARKVMLGKNWLRRSAGYPVYVPRLLHRAGPRFFMRGHGEWVEVAPSRQVLFKHPLIHHNFSRGWTDWYDRHNRYSSAEAARMVAGLAEFTLADLWSPERTARRQALRALSYRLPGRPLLRFLYSYLLQMGFLDGRAGYDYCRAMAAYEHMINLKVREKKFREI
jgi:glycosyltransferase involved in cell wall biosynthesis